MLDFGFFEIDTSVFVFIVSVLVLLLQLLLCFKVKRFFIRLLPIVLFLVVAIVFVVMIPFSSGWDSLGFLFLAIFFGYVALVCGIGWGIWAIVKHKKRKTIK